MYSTPHITLYFVGKKNTEAAFCVSQQNFHKLINFTSFLNCNVCSLMTQYFLVIHKYQWKTINLVTRPLQANLNLFFLYFYYQPSYSSSFGNFEKKLDADFNVTKRFFYDLVVFMSLGPMSILLTTIFENLASIWKKYGLILKFRRVRFSWISLPVCALMNVSHWGFL